LFIGFGRAYAAVFYVSLRSVNGYRCTACFPRFFLLVFFMVRAWPPIMPKNKRPRQVSPKDWDPVDSPALSDDILAAMRPARETFPELAEASAKRKRGERGPQKKPRKVLISLGVEAGTVEAFKARGRGYQTRMAAVLKKHAKQA
jgi:uncharacterized protein (DUF4415 family)